MTKLKTILLLWSCAITLLSCQKELSMDTSSGTAGSKTLNGNWKFLGMHAKTESILEMTDGVDVLKTITVSEYYSTKNTGTVSFDDTKVTSTNFSYEVDTIAKGWIYENNILVDSLLAPFSFAAPASGSQSTYTKVNADSIYVAGGQLSGIGGTGPVGQPTGIKLEFQGNNLLMRVKVSSSDVQQSGGIRQTKKQSVNAVMTYQRL